MTESDNFSLLAHYLCLIKASREILFELFLIGGWVFLSRPLSFAVQDHAFQRVREQSAPGILKLKKHFLHKTLPFVTLCFNESKPFINDAHRTCTYKSGKFGQKPGVEKPTGYSLVFWLYPTQWQQPNVVFPSYVNCSKERMGFIFIPLTFRCTVKTKQTKPSIYTAACTFASLRLIYSLSTVSLQSVLHFHFILQKLKI